MKLYSQMPELKGATTWINSKVRRSHLIGERPTLFYFWSISCYLCEESIKDVHKICRMYNDQLNVVTVHMPLSRKDTNVEEISDVAKKFHIDQPLFVDNDLILSNQFENTIVPSCYLFDKTGALRHFQSGKSSIKLLQNRLERIVGS